MTKTIKRKEVKNPHNYIIFQENSDELENNLQKVN